MINIRYENRIGISNDHPFCRILQETKLQSSELKKNIYDVIVIKKYDGIVIKKSKGVENLD